MLVCVEKEKQKSTDTCVIERECVSWGEGARAIGANAVGGGVAALSRTSPNPFPRSSGAHSIAADTFDRSRGSRQGLFCALLPSGTAAKGASLPCAIAPSVCCAKRPSPAPSVGSTSAADCLPAGREAVLSAGSWCVVCYALSRIFTARRQCFIKWPGVCVCVCVWRRSPAVCVCP